MTRRNEIMLRKWMLLPAVTIAVTAMVAGLALADDEDSPLHKKMEEVNKANLAIKKAIRTAVAYKKAQASNEIVKQADELAKLGKEARGLGKDALKRAKNVKDPEKRWGELMDAFIMKTEEFSAQVAKPSTSQEAAKSAFGVVSQSCTNCHNDFRVEEESF
jgi:cytochrome c556